MTKKPIFWLVLSAGVMLLIPWLVVMFVQSDAGMAAILVLFFGIDPVYCAMAGYYAGKQIRCLWWLPMLDAGLFLAGTWLLLEMGETAFLTYTGIYFTLGMGAMLVSRLITVRRGDNG